MPHPGRGRTSTVLLPSAAVTTMPFEGPYQSPIHRFGTEGLNLRDAADRLKATEMSRADNLEIRGDGEVQTRWGQHEFATSAGTKVHSGRELRDPRGGNFTRIWGIDSNLYIGQDGGLSNIDSGYSGDPLVLVPLRPDHGGDSWMYVADRDRMRKVRNDGLNLPIGVPEAAKPTTALTAVERTDVARFDTQDATDSANWTTFPGFTVDPPLQPFVFDFGPIPPPPAPPFGNKEGPGAVAFTSIGQGIIPVPEDAPDPWFYTSIPLALDLSVVGSRPATDDDHLHFWIAMLKASLIVEFRIYFISKDVLDPTQLPGRHEGNPNAFIKNIRPRDLAGALLVDSTFRDAFATEAPAESDPDFMSRTATEKDLSLDNTDTSPPPLIPLTLSAGQGEWIEFGVIDKPFRRGSFFTLGDPDWAQITGMMIMIRSRGDQGGGGAVVLDDMYLHGGYGPDSSEPEAIKYDVRVTDFDTRTGTEGNPSEEQDEDTEWLEPIRQGIEVTPVAKGDASFRQRVYVRGGTNFDDWHRAGENDADGGLFTIEEDDIELRSKDGVELDHDEPVTSVDSDGETLLAQPARFIIPLGDLLVAFGEKVRPGFIYWCRTGQFGHWPPQNTDEVCPPGEELMGGVPYGGQAYIFSRKRLYIAYQNLTAAGTVVSTNTPCHRGLHSPWAVTVGERGIYAVDTDGIFLTTGNVPTEVAERLYSLFHREERNGYQPINMSQSEEMRLVAMDGRVFFQYEDYDGDTHVAVYDERRDRWIGIWTFGQEPGTIWVENDESITPNLVRFRMGGKTTGSGYSLSDTAFSDDGVAIAGLLRTGMWDGNLQRENKQLGDAVLDCDAALTQIDAVFRMDLDTVVNATLMVPATNDGRRQFILDAFGTVPQFARTVSLEVSWSSSTGRPRLYEWGIGFLPIPEETNRRATQYDDTGSANEKYCTGVMVECDTFNVVKPFKIDYDLLGNINQVQNITPNPTGIIDQTSVTSNGRHRFFFSWPKVKANLLRLRPVDACIPWILYKLEWSVDPEPARIADIDSNFEEHHDSYYTGLDIVLDTFGLEKQITLYVDGVQLVHPTTGESFWRVTTSGKQTAHLTTTPAYGHIFRYVAIDDNPALDYTHHWFLQAQPSEQANWNQGFSVGGTRADKWMKGVVLEIDTFGVTKTVRVEVDGGPVESFQVLAAGRRVIQHAFAAQARGRVMRVFSVDGLAARLWPPPQIIFDEEPLALQRWETQEITHGLDGWMIPVEAKICYRSTAPVNIIVTSTIGDDGTTVVDTYTAALPSTADAKHKLPFFFKARKGLLFKYVLTSAADFYLYREESELHVQPWGVADQRPIVKPFGNDDMDADRTMRAKGTPDSDVPRSDDVVPSVPQAQ